MVTLVEYTGWKAKNPKHLHGVSHNNFYTYLLVSLLQVKW